MLSLFAGLFFGSRFFRTLKHALALALIVCEANAFAAVQFAARPAADDIALYQNREIWIEDQKSALLLGFDDVLIERIWLGSWEVRAVPGGRLMKADAGYGVDRTIGTHQNVAGQNLARLDNRPLAVFALAEACRWIAAEGANHNCQRWASARTPSSPRSSRTTQRAPHKR